MERVSSDAKKGWIQKIVLNRTSFACRILFSHSQTVVEVFVSESKLGCLVILTSRCDVTTIDIFHQLLWSRVYTAKVSPLSMPMLSNSTMA